MAKHVSRKSRAVSQRMVMWVCHKLLEHEDPADPESGSKPAAVIAKELIVEFEDEVADLKAKYGLKFNRQSVYAILAEAFARKMMVLNPPRDEKLAADLQTKFKVNGGRSIHVVDCPAGYESRYTAQAAADVVFGQICRLQREGKKQIHLGFGAGITNRDVARALGACLRTLVDYPDLVIHTLTSGFSVHDPHIAPISFLGYFEQSKTKCVALFTPPLVRTSDYESQIALPTVSDAFNRAHEIDIVVTSLAEADHEHGLLTSYMHATGDDARQTREALTSAKWQGDVQFQPYSLTGPIEISNGMRAVTLFDLPALVKFAADPKKCVVLVGGPCAAPKCGKTKTKALIPLLHAKDLRMWSRLVLDSTTAQELLAAK